MAFTGVMLMNPHPSQQHANIYVTFLEDSLINYLSLDIYQLNLYKSKYVYTSKVNYIKVVGE